jgi:hypothetical protein
MKSFDTRVYSVADFLEWHTNDLLQLSPDFQRRAVWSEKAKSYLIDTILNGKPIPKILITQGLNKSRNVRVVVDGQQRLRAILEFVEGAFKVSKAHSDEYGGKSFNKLPEDVQREFLKYELGVDVLFDLSYEDILDVFARLNSYTVKLNKQELFNATYLGYFKQAAYTYGFKYVQYYLKGGILTKAAVTRMAEAELSADLMMSLVGGVQSNKNVETYYRDFDDVERLEKPDRDLAKAKVWFDETMTYLGAIYSPEDIANTNWSRIHLFYTLFTSIAHCLHGLNGVDANTRAKFSQKDIPVLRIALDQLSGEYDRVAANPEDKTISKDLRDFLDRSRRRTTDTGARNFRTEFVCKRMTEALK